MTMKRTSDGGWVLVLCLSLAGGGCSNSDGLPGSTINVQRLAAGSAPGGASLFDPACTLPAHFVRYGLSPPTGKVHVVPVFWTNQVDPTVQSSIYTSMRVFAGSQQITWLKRQYGMPSLTIDQ